MIREQFIGQLPLEDDWLIWRLPNGIIIKVACNKQPSEGYIETSYLDNKKEIYLTHWHPMEENIYRDLYEINIGHIFWVVKKKLLFKNPPLIMDKNVWKRYSEKRKNKYIVLSL